MCFAMTYTYELHVHQLDDLIIIYHYWHFYLLFIHRKNESVIDCV